MFFWSRKKVRFLERNFHNTKDSELAKIIGISESMIRAKAKELGLDKGEIVDHNDKPVWSQAEIDLLHLYYPIRDNAYLAHELGKEKFQIEHQAFRLGLSKESGYFDFSLTDEEEELLEQWEEEYHRSLGSKGHFLLGKSLEEVFPFYRRVEEYPIEHLRLDWYVPEFKLGAEYDGIQHSQYNQFFHESKYDFREGQERDYRKSEMCEERGIALIRFSHKEKPTPRLVQAKVMDVI